MINYSLNTIQIIKKANKYTFGDGLIAKIRQGKIYLVVISKDMGLTNKKKVQDKCQTYDVKYIEMLDKVTLNSLFNKAISCFGITDENLAKKLLENIKKS